MADTAKTAQGFISLKAYRLTPEAIKMFRENDFSPDYVKVRRYSINHHVASTGCVIILSP
jgi:translation initiation factor 3 subunit H